MVRSSLPPNPVPVLAPTRAEGRSARPPGKLDVIATMACDDGDWPYRNLLRGDEGLRLRHVRSPHEELLDAPACHVVLLRGPDAVGEAARLLGTPGEGTPPVLLICPTDEPRQLADALRLGVTSCLAEGDYDGRMLLHALRSTAAGHTHISPAVRDCAWHAATSGVPATAPAASVTSGIFIASAASTGSSTVPSAEQPGGTWAARPTAPGAPAGPAGTTGPAGPASSPGRGAQLRRMLSPRERQVMDLVASGVKVAEIGRRMSLTAKTVRNYLWAIYTKLGVSTRTEAVLLWLDARPHPEDAPGRSLLTTSCG
ncbi:helix-turn-helix transcriptional regulator [Streptomyces cavernae]|uniref:helix-turn-helix transcriptional regulator n=1 Tax=Streptomyces cavernae TaxID=2259034 RepID=UPI000FEB863C|nr:LuxR C-terminal-related transcriptional regulator [Streptomyces cavernae]